RPAARHAATAPAGRVPLNLSGASTMRRRREVISITADCSSSFLDCQRFDCPDSIRSEDTSLRGEPMRIPLENRTLGESLANSLRDRILRGEIAIGQPLTE